MTAVELPKWAEALWEPYRHVVLYGGRGGAKSWTVARVLLIRAAQRKMRVLCAREFMNSLSDSVAKLLGEQIVALGLSDFYEVQQNVIRGRNGSEFSFAGLRGNAASIRSREGVDVVWCEEAQAISEESWQTLIPTIRKEGSAIWVVMNPLDDDDATYRRFVVETPPDTLKLFVNWNDNPWLPSVLLDEIKHDFATDPDLAEHVWNGQTRKVSDAQVLRGRWVVEEFLPTKEFAGSYFGLDLGFATDPTVLTKSWIHERTLYVEHEAVGYGVDIEDTPALLARIPGAKDHTIRADCARPETISHLRRHGFSRMLPCTKWSGSVEDGTEFLRSFTKIVIHPRCELTIKEAKLWSFKVDRLSGDVMPDLVDANNNSWDSIRYALEPIIRSGKPRPLPVKVPPKPRDYDFNRVRKKSWKSA